MAGGLAVKVIGSVLDGGDKNKLSNELGAGFFDKLQDYRQGVPTNYSPQFMKKLARYDKLNGTTTKFGEEKEESVQDKFANKARTAEAAKSGMPSWAVGLAWYWWVLIAGGVVAVGWFLVKKVFKRKRRR